MEPNFAFDRQPDPTVLKIRTNTATTPDSVASAIDAVLADMRLDRKAVKIISRPVARTFTLQFTGGKGLAANRSEKFIQLLRVEGEWRQLEAELPAG